jgi:D-3-phosphoglycerate dehydrogenase
MSPWNILVTDGLDHNGLNILRQSGSRVDLQEVSPDELLTVAPRYDALIVRGRTKVTAAVLEAAPQLKVVGRAGVGVDNIDLKAAAARSVTVVNAPVATTIAVAELTLALLLASVREVPRADAQAKAGKWIKKELEGTELSGKTLGIVGCGRIGRAVAVRAAAFGMRVLGFDNHLAGDALLQAGIRAVTLEELFAAADIISLHIPLTDSTRGLLNAAAFAQMKTGVRIVCAARGGIIDESALLQALADGKVASAALDVFSIEPPGQTALVSHPRVIVTPHVGAQTVEAQARASEDIAVEVLAALDQQPLRWKVA